MFSLVLITKKKKFMPLFAALHLFFSFPYGVCLLLLLFLVISDESVIYVS